MTAAIEKSVERQSWKALGSHYTKVSKLHLRELFEEDPERGERMTAEAVGLFLDYSKNRITDETLKLLFRVADGAARSERIIHCRRRRRCGAEGPCCARQDG